MLLVRGGLCETDLSVRELAVTAFGVALEVVRVLVAQIGQEYLLQPFPLHWVHVEPLLGRTECQWRPVEEAT